MTNSKKDYLFRSRKLNKNKNLTTLLEYPVLKRKISQDNRLIDNFELLLPKDQDLGPPSPEWDCRLPEMVILSKRKGLRVQVQKC